jgi:hypothetical protein
MSKFKRSLHKVSQFPSTKRASSMKLKTLLLGIGMEASRTADAGLEAKKLCEAFLAQFEGEVEQPVKVETKPTEKPTVKFTQEQLEGLHYKKVDEVAEKFGVSTDGNKAETIIAILSAQG